MDELSPQAEAKDIKSTPTMFHVKHSCFFIVFSWDFALKLLKAQTCLVIIISYVYPDS